ncbi:uncharacterized protein LOC143217728 [Lasioglossum baleicum]|uniref:uncharacterized protein LOC143217728 n=1 Tax=Lasioglossum baleicum TaxID=434251 RepID=UPI003FCD9F0A
MENSQQNIPPRSSSSSGAINSPWTPRTRRIQRFSLNVNVSPVEEEEPIEGLSELLNQTWTVYGVSTLFNFHQDEVHLKQYSKRLREEIAATLTQEDVAYKAKMFVMDNVTTRPSPMDPIPIKIDVYGKNYANENSTEKCIYTGILLSWKTTTSELATPNSIRLPLLLCRGTRSSMNAIHTLLSRMFDCVIIELSAQEDDLMWLIPIIITPTSNERHSKGEIRMEYRIPGLPDTNAIVVKFQVSDLIKILRIVMKDQIDTSRDEIFFNLEHIKKFRALLYEQILQTASLQLGLCILCKISLPSFSIRGNKMKIGNTETMNRVLLYLNKKAVGILHTLTSEL